MKKLLLFMLLFLSPGLVASPLFVSLRIPVSYNIISPDQYARWDGASYGAGLSAEIQIMRFLFIEYGVCYTKEKLNLPEKDFQKGSYISMKNLWNTLNAKVYFFRQFYASLGFRFISQLSGTFGSRDVSEREIQDDYLGTDIYLNLVLGYRIHLSDRIFIPVEMRMDQDLTISKSSVLHIGLEAGCGFRFDIVKSEKKQ